MPLIDMNRLVEGKFIDYSRLATLIWRESLLLTQACSSAYARRSGASPNDNLVFLQMYNLFGINLYLYGIKLLQARLRDDYDWPSKAYDNEITRMLDAFMNRLESDMYADIIRNLLKEPKSTETVKQALILGCKQYEEINITDYIDKILEMVVGV